MSKYCRVSQVNILDICSNVTRYFVSRFTANYFHIFQASHPNTSDISVHISLSVTSIFIPASHCEYSRFYVCHLTINYLDILSLVSLWIISTFLPASYGKLFRYFFGRQVKLLEISPWVRRLIISTSCTKPVGKLTPHFSGVSWWIF